MSKGMPGLSQEPSTEWYFNLPPKSIYSTNFIITWPDPSVPAVDEDDRMHSITAPDYYFNSSITC